MHRNLILVALVVGAMGAWMFGAPCPAHVESPDGINAALGDDAPNDPSLLLNRIWIQRVPRDERDMVMRLVAIKDGEVQLGVAVMASQWRTLLEVFRFQLDGNRMALEFPQDRRKAEALTRAWKCKGEAPEPFELCLEVRIARRTVGFYSMEDWVVEPGQRGHALLGAADLAELRRSHARTEGACPDCTEGLPALVEPTWAP